MAQLIYSYEHWHAR